MQSSKVHIKGKATRKSINYTGKKNEINKIYRYGNYGLGSELSGVNAKYSLILKGSFDIVNFDEYFLIRNFNNKKDIEYFWGGIVPPEGKRTQIMFSKKEATWSFSQEISFFNFNYFKGENAIVYAPIEYIGGNNEIININQSPKKNFIKIDEENRRFIIELDKNLTTLKFNVNGELKNKCKGEWNVHLTDEEVDKLMPKEDIKCKEQLKKIAQKIINDFDKEHKNSDFEFLDYMKIGFWVHKNIKYDMNYSGKKMSAMEIYNLKKGVCHHFTLLSNALLYSLGYKVLYVTCLCCQKNQKMNRFDLHAHSLIKIGNKWYPFDSTWCILTGKLFVGHVFLKYGSSLFCEYDKKDFIIPYMDDNCQFIK